MSDASLSRSLARFVTGLQYDDLGSGQKTTIGQYFLDWLGCAVGGSSTEPARLVMDTVREMGGVPEATCVADGSRTCCANAALVNGVASHVLEMDDVHREALIHMTVPVAPAALAVAERRHASGRGLLTALAAGVEVFIRVALGVGPSHYNYWHTTATCGVFGAAAAAAKLLGLDEQQTIWALGTAGTQAGGLWEFLSEGVMSKVLHPGRAASNGVLSALLAQRGFTGVSTILEGEQGFFRATSTDFDIAKVTDGLGEVFHFEGGSIKYHASCGHTHAAVDAALAATSGRRLGPDQVERVDVDINAVSLGILEGVCPDTPYLGKFCLEFCVASALARGPLGLDAFTEQTVADPDLRALAGKVFAVEAPDLTAQYPACWPGRVRVTLKGGEVLEGAVECPKGDPGNPLSEDELLGKFMDLAGRSVPEARASTLAARALGLAELEDVNDLLTSTR